MNLSNKQYSEMVNRNAPKSPIIKNTIVAFLIGGGICTLGQVINNILMHCFGDKEIAAPGTSIILVFIGALLTALRVYDDIAKAAGAGSLVPITGFANSVVSPSMEFKFEGIITGVCTKMFTIAGPVIVFSILGSVVYGIVLLFVKT